MHRDADLVDQGTARVFLVTNVTQYVFHHHHGAVHHHPEIERAQGEQVGGNVAKV